MSATPTQDATPSVQPRSDAMTVVELQRRCTHLARRISPRATVTAHIHGHGPDVLAVYEDGYKLTGFRIFKAADGWDAAFAEAEAWLAARPNPDAEYDSWGVAA